MSLEVTMKIPSVKLKEPSQEEIAQEFLDIIEHIDPNWREDFAELTHAVEYYSQNMAVWANARLAVRY